MDAQAGEYKDMVGAGHHRPDAGGAGGVFRVPLHRWTVLITTEAMVGDRPEPKGVPGMPHDHGMGGMGGMVVMGGTDF